MAQRKEMTDYHIKWMQENYGKVSRKDCAQHFQVSTTTIDRWAKQLGLRKQQGSKVIREKRKVPVEGEDSAEVESGYCLDCKHYIFGGFCGKTNRHTGALNEKQCFKRNKQ